MAKFIVIAYYTPRYKQEAEELEKTLKEFNLDYEIKAIEDKGGWDRNTHYKPMIIREALEKYRKPVLYVDADARIKKYPALIDEIAGKYDIAYHCYGGWRVASGTLLFDYNQRVIDFIKEWEAECQKEESLSIWEQKILEELLKERRLKTYLLPEDYLYIFDLAITKCEPVILHTQASRRFKEV
ncbi:MAG: hypothetical protein AB7E08_03040 [Candidatus Omnitrophota bacterium]